MGIEIKRFTKDIDVNDKEVVIYGAGIYGEIALYGLRYLHIEPKFFCDEKLAGGEKAGVEIKSPKELEEIKDVLVIIASLNYFMEMVEALAGWGYECCYEIIDFFTFPLKGMSAQASNLFEQPNRYKEVVEHCKTKEKGYVGHIEITVAEGCTMRCRNCATLSPYYKYPKIIYLSENKKAIDRFLNAVGYVSEIRLLGGEPFLNSKIYEYVDNYKDNPKIGSIVIYTNGTIIPNDRVLKSLKHPKIRVRISDYGHNHEKVLNITRELETRNISFFVSEYDYWQDLGMGDMETDSQEDRKIKFRYCMAKNCMTILRTKLYRCSHEAHGVNLGYIPIFEDEIIDLGNESIDEMEIQSAIRKLLFEIEELKACDYCKGMDGVHNKIRAAEQLD